MVKVRKGFTLVELLIVIVIIGILAAAMLLSMGSATDSAQASNVVSELRNLKAAALMFYADSSDTIGTLISSGAATDNVSYIAKYMDNPEKTYSSTAPTGKYLLKENADGKWFVGMDLSKHDAATAGVKQKLADRAKNTGLFYNSATAAPTSLTDFFTSAQSDIWMVAR